MRKGISLAEYDPEIAAEWHPTKNGDLTPDKVTHGSNRRVWWICSKCGHEWVAKPGTRAKGHGCKICGRRQANRARSINAAKNGNSIAESNPLLAKEWDYSRNPPDRTPNNVTPWSDTQYFWICPRCGISYETTVTNRSSGQGCPVCAQEQRKTSRHQTNLSTIGTLADSMPDLAAEWNYERNQVAHQIDPTHPLTPNDVTPGSKKNVWWRCSHGHEYRAVVYSRKAGTGCPRCDAERKTSLPEQVLYFYLRQVAAAESQHPLGDGREIDIFLPEYALGIEYDGSAWHQNLEKDLDKNSLCRVKGIRLLRVREPGCPSFPEECITLIDRTNNELKRAVLSICSTIGKSVDVNIERDLPQIYPQYFTPEKQSNIADKYPEIAAEWHPTLNEGLTPSSVAPKSNKTFWWLCPEGHAYRAKASERTRGRGCPYCAGKKVWGGFNDLASVNSTLADQWHAEKNGDFTPSAVTPNSHKKAWWRCPVCGYEWQAEIKSRNRGCGCPNCAGKIPANQHIGELRRKE